MGIFDKLRGEFIDIIEWTDPSQNTLAYRFERYGNEIKNGAKLTVRPGQVAVFVNEGKIADVFEPGMYELKTENLPILSTLLGWKYGFNSPFKAEVYFISTKNMLDQKWGTKNAITLSDSRFGMLELRAFGTYTMKVNDAPKFLKEIVGTDGHFTNDEIAEQLRSIVVTRFTDSLGEANFPVEALAANLNELSKFVDDIMKPEFGQYGIELTKFLIENVSMPDEVKKEIFELSRLDKIDLGKLAQMKAAKALEKAAENEGGTAGAGIGMGMGFAMANQMGQMFSGTQGNQQQAAGTPPPIPGAVSYFVVQKGQQTGPFDINTLKQMAQTNTLSRESLVWKNGMPEWVKAETVDELKQLFENVPPPIPSA
jgi:membrane protease subunit (stomatin/prohibitin family)